MKQFEVRQKKDTRSGFGDALFELGRENEKVVGLCAYLTGSLKMGAFKKEFPDRFFQTGIAEANMIGMAAGMATAGLIPFTGTFANFSTGRVYDQIRQSVAYSDKNVKICASHSGLTLGEDGATHQILEDIAMMRAMPNMTVINTCDYTQTFLATKAIADFSGPVYLRFGRPSVPDFSPNEFEIGKGILLSEGADVAIIATGHMVWEALKAAEQLEQQGYTADVINIHTIKPIDEDIVLNSAAKCGCVVTAEEHVLNGGLGEAVASVLSRNKPVPVEMIGVNDSFGESGKPMELLEKYGLSAADILKATLKAIERRKA